MLKWIDVIKFTNKGNPPPDRTVRRTDAEWRAQLTPEQYQVTRRKGTERAFSSDLCGLFEPGRYACVCCDTLLFDAAEKFDSGTGWPSFTQPVKENAVAYHLDKSYGMRRVETTCNTCEAHLGHVFPDGPAPSGLRYCMNAAALAKVNDEGARATFGGGCFWCTEAVFRRMEGVIDVTAGYAGGTLPNPTYREVTSGRTGHAEVVQVTYDPARVAYADLVRVHLATHEPALTAEQTGSNYRSLILTHDEAQADAARKALTRHQADTGREPATEVGPLEAFYAAEEKHQDYYGKHPEKPFCTGVIDPKLRKLRDASAHLLKPAVS
ncbi:MAG: peptide-methionine (R)-S-oxide reductase MsrB [Catalinimonas sp.]